MVELAPMLMIGDSKDADHGDLRRHQVSAILCVAHDMQCRRGWTDGIEFAQCGLVDGPGSNIAAYHAAVMKLASLIGGGRKVLVCDHESGGRAVSVCLMYLNMAKSRDGWDKWLAAVNRSMGKPDFSPHEAHRSAFNRLNWRLISQAMEE